MKNTNGEWSGTRLTLRIVELVEFKAKSIYHFWAEPLKSWPRFTKYAHWFCFAKRKVTAHMPINSKIQYR
jgi:hypothetical protein